MEEKATIRINCVLCGIVVLLVVMIFFLNSTVTNNIEPTGAEYATISLMAKEPRNCVATSSSISSTSSVATSDAVTASTSSSISSDKDEKEKKERQRKKKLKKQRRKKRLMQQKKRAERRRKLLERKRAQQKKITKAKAYSYTNQELLTLGEIIWEEARGESYVGKVAVGAVAMNRLRTKSKEFGAENGNLMEVLLKKWAFAEITISDDEFRQSVYYNDCIRAAKDAFNGEDPTDRKSVV